MSVKSIFNSISITDAFHSLYHKGDQLYQFAKEIIEKTSDKSMEYGVVTDGVVTVELITQESRINKLFSDYTSVQTSEMPFVNKMDAVNKILEKFCDDHIDTLKLTPPFRKEYQKNILTWKLEQVLMSCTDNAREDVHKWIAKYTEFLSQCEKILKNDTSFEESLDNLIQLPLDFITLPIAQPEVLNLVLKFVSGHWHELKIPNCFNHQKDHLYLAEKLTNILMSKHQSIDVKQEIIRTVLKNFQAFTWEFYDRFEKDRVDEAFCSTFCTHPKDEIAEVTILGQETHNRGRVPIKVTLKNHQSSTEKAVVYKPRSMLPEQAVCGESQGLFSQVGEDLATFQVLDKIDYGYCRFIKNVQSENMIKNDDELEKYAMQFFLLDAFSKKLGIADLHSLNIITENLCPFPTDLEVIMLPNYKPNYNPQLLEGPQAGWVFDQETRNRVWIEGKEHCLILSNLSDKIRAIKNDANKQAEIQEILHKNQDNIQECQQRLFTKKHRFVPTPTPELVFEIGLDLERGFQEFKSNLIEGLKDWEGEIFENQINSTKELFFDDLKNNDVPIFYFDPKEKLIYYYNLAIARL